MRVRSAHPDGRQQVPTGQEQSLLPSRSNTPNYQVVNNLMDGEHKEDQQQVLSLDNNQKQSVGVTAGFQLLQNTLNKLEPHAYDSVNKQDKNHQTQEDEADREPDETAKPLDQRL